MRQSPFRKSISKANKQQTAMETAIGGCRAPECGAPAALPAPASRWGHRTSSGHRSQSQGGEHTFPSQVPLGGGTETLQSEVGRAWVCNLPLGAAVQEHGHNFVWARSQLPQVKPQIFGAGMSAVSLPSRKEERPRGSDI